MIVGRIFIDFSEGGNGSLHVPIAYSQVRGKQAKLT